MAWKLSNFADGTLAQAAAELDTTIWVTPALAALLPTLAPGDKAKAVVFNSEFKEIVNIADIDLSGELTVERAQEDTAARAWAAGTRIIHTPTAEILQLVLSTITATTSFGTATLVGSNYSVNVGAGVQIPTLTDGEELVFVVPTANPGAVTASVTNGVDTTAVKDIEKHNAIALRAGDMAVGWLAVLRYSTAANSWLFSALPSPQGYNTEINEAPLDDLNMASNGDFSAWNSGTTFNTPSSGAETADNLYATYDGTIGVFTVNRQTFTIGQTDVAGNPRHFARWDQSNAGTGSGFRRLTMRILDAARRAGENITLSAYLKADTNRNVTATVLQHFGTGGGPSADVSVGSEVWALTTSWQRFDITVALPSVAGKTRGSNNDDAILLRLDLPVNVVMTIDVAQLRCEPGQVATRPGAEFPVSLKKGGTGIACETLAALAAFLLATTTLTDLAAIEALSGTSGFLNKTAANTWALRTMQNTTGLTWTNPAGVAGDPSVALSTGLVNYHNDPMSVAELASITAPFGTAAFVNTGTSGATVPLLNASNIFSALTVIAFSATSTMFNVQNTDAGALGVQVDTAHASASPAVNDVAYRHRMVARNDAAGNIVYGLCDFVLTDVAAGTEDGDWRWSVMNNGVSTENLRLSKGQVLAPGGSAAATAFGIIGDTNTGLWSDTGDFIRFATGGTNRMDLSTTALIMRSATVVQNNDGSVSTPAYSFINDTDTGVYRIGADNVGVSLGNSLKLDLSTTRALFTGSMDAVLGTAALAPTSIYSLGYRGTPVISGNSAYAFPASDAGSTIYHDEAGTRTYTIPANASVAHPIGTVFIIDNTGNSGAAGAITLAITSDTLRRGDGVAGTGTRTISANQVAMIRKVTSTIWIITGVFS